MSIALFTRSISSSAYTLFPICWRCGAETAPKTTVDKCKRPSCGALQPIPPSATFYDLLLSKSTLQPGAVNPEFSIDVKKIKEMYLKLQHIVHPDSFTNKTPEEREISEKQSALINKAFWTLKDPLSRAKYLLSLHDVRIEEGSSLEDQSTVMEIFELWESIDDANTKEELTSLQRKNDELLKWCTSTLNGSFNNKDYRLAKELTIRLQYYIKIRKTLDEKMFELDV